MSHRIAIDILVKIVPLTSSVVTNRAIDINGETSGQVGQETNGSQGNSVHVTKSERAVNDDGKNKDGDNGRLVSKSNTVNHVGSRSSLARVGNFTDGFVTVTGVVLGDETNNETTNGTHADTDNSGVGSQLESGVTDRRSKFKRFGQEVVTGKVEGRDHENRGRDELDLEGRFDLVFGLDSEEVRGNERAEQADKDSGSTDNDWEHHGAPSSRDTDTASNHKSGARRFGKRTEKITSHT